MNTLSVAQLDETLGFQVRLAQLKMFEHFNQHFSHIGMSVGEYSVLLAVGENPGVRQGDLAKYFLIKRSNMSKVMRAMEQRGLVERRESESDGRALAIYLTTEGQDLVYGLIDELSAYHQEPAPGLNANEQIQLVALLKKISLAAKPGPVD
ncbi:MAG: MarR family transcriptional regulator [Hyphomicrobiales bacterium]|nr:MAG: MarR family transcriptional regulator [Hyphomicrobiales bacterium]